MRVKRYIIYGYIIMGIVAIMAIMAFVAIWPYHGLWHNGFLWPCKGYRLNKMNHGVILIGAVSKNPYVSCFYEYNGVSWLDDPLWFACNGLWQNGDIILIW